MLSCAELYRGDVAAGNQRSDRQVTRIDEIDEHLSTAILFGGDDARLEAFAITICKHFSRILSRTRNSASSNYLC